MHCTVCIVLRLSPHVPTCLLWLLWQPGLVRSTHVVALMPPVAVLLLHRPQQCLLGHTSEQCGGGHCAFHSSASGVLKTSGGSACFIISGAGCPGHVSAPTSCLWRRQLCAGSPEYAAFRLRSRPLRVGRCSSPDLTSASPQNSPAPADALKLEGHRCQESLDPGALQGPA